MQKGLATGIDMNAVAEICISLVIIYAAGAVLSYGQQFIMATVTQRVSKSLRGGLNAKINKLPLNYFDTDERRAYRRRREHGVNLEHHHRNADKQHDCRNQVRGTRANDDHGRRA